MAKKLDLNKTVYELTQEYPKLLKKSLILQLAIKR